MVYDFRLGNKNLSDFDGVILAQETDIDTVQLLNKTEDMNLDGQVLFGSRYSPREFNFSVYFDDGLDKEKVRELTAWIMCKDEQELEFFGDERYEGLVINVIYTGALNISNYGVFNVGNSINLSFTAYDPYWRVKRKAKVKINNPVLVNKYKFSDSESNVETYPLISLKPLTEEVRFYWYTNASSYLEVRLKNLNTSKEYYIDSENGSVYYIENGNKINAYDKFTISSTYSMLYKTAYTDCYFKLMAGSVSYVNIQPNSRVI